MDFDSPAAAQKAVASLKASGVQAQMAKVNVAPVCRSFTYILYIYKKHIIIYSICFLCHQVVFPQRRLRC